MSFVKSQQEGAVLTLTLDRPEALNALNQQVLDDLSAALDALVKLNCPPFPVLGLAKKNEEIYLPGRSEPLILDRHSPALRLLQAVRDEAHRFAITHHRTLRNSTMQKSQLEDIPLIGPGRRRALLARFHSVRKMREAPLEELLSVPGMTKQAAENLYAVLHRDDKN